MKTHLPTKLLWSNLKKYFCKKGQKNICITKFEFSNELDKHNLIVQFVSQFNLVLQRFADSFLKTIILEKNNNKLSYEEAQNKLFELQKKYNRSKYEYVYQLMASTDTLDFVLLLNLIDYKLLDMKEICYDYHIKIIKNITFLYWYLNTIIECNLFYYSSRWGELNTLHYLKKLFSEEDFYIIPTWIDLYFRNTEFKKLVQKYNYQPNDSLYENVMKIIKIEKINELLKVLFRYLYVFYALGKYSRLEKSNIFTNVFITQEDFCIEKI